MERETILLIEDNPTNVDILSDLLENTGYRVLVALNGEAGLEHAAAGKPDLILLDIMMPGLDGFDVCRRLKENPDTKEIPLIFMTALSDTRKKLEGFQLGACDYITKPFQQDELLARIRIHLTIKDQMRAFFENRMMETLVGLAGGIAHEFNNKLFLITGNIELIRDDFLHFPTLQRYLDVMEDASQKMHYLTQQLIAYARTGKQRERTLCLSGFVRDSVAIIEHTLRSHVQIDARFHEYPLYVSVDPAQMQMVLSAIITNAAEACQSTGMIDISVSREDAVPPPAPGEEGETVRQLCSFAAVIIKDNGRGMEPETAERVCEPFFTTKFKGRGMSMAAAYGIIKEHNGHIAIDSEPGKGTIVTIYLPMADENAVALPVQQKRFRGSGTVLLVEDEPAVMEVTAAMLQRLGYTVMRAGTGNEALSILESQKRSPDLVLLDVELPDMRMETLCEKIGRYLPGIRIILCIGSKIDDPSELLNWGAENYIKKPYRLSELSRILRNQGDGSD